MSDTAHDDRDRPVHEVDCFKIDPLNFSALLAKLRDETTSDFIERLCPRARSEGAL